MRKLKLINGNHKPYTVDVPKIVILTDHINDVALEWIRKQTGLKLEKRTWGYEVQPKSTEQIVKLLLTYDYKTRYINNWNSKNTLYFKSDHHIGFDVNSICYDCCVENRVNVNGLKKGDRLAC